MSEHFICMAALNVYYYLFQHDTIDLYLFTIYFVTSKFVSINFIKCTIVTNKVSEISKVLP